MGETRSMIRKVGEPSGPFGVGDMVPIAAGAVVPDGWEIAPDAEVRVVEGGAGAYRKMSESEEREAVARFIAGESASDLAKAYVVPVGTIERVITWAVLWAG